MPDATKPPTSATPSAAEPSLRLGPAAPPTSTDPYRPLSMLALAGFGLSVLFAILVLGGGVVSFAIHVPWLLTFWAAAVPVAAITMCLVARQQIRESEGTRTGEALATTGIFLSIVVSLGYVAYYAGTRYAVLRAAEDFVQNTWFDRLRKGDVEKAFLYTLEPPRATENDPDLRDQYETLFNSGKDTPFSVFPYSVAELILQGGPKTAYELKEVSDWGYDKGYRVTLVYNVTTPFASGLMMVTVQSHEGGTKDVPGRTWYVVRDGTKALKEDFNALGQKLLVLAHQGHIFVESWASRLGADPIGAFLSTLPAAERFKYQKAASFMRAAGLAGPAFLVVDPPDVREFKSQLDRFQAGSLLSAAPPAFWWPDSKDPAKSRATLLRDMRSAFRPTGPTPTTINLMQNMKPFWSEQDGLVRFRYEADLVAPKFKGEGVIVVSTKLLPDGDPTPQTWRVESVELARGRLVQPEPTGGRGRMQSERRQSPPARR